MKNLNKKLVAVVIAVAVTGNAMAQTTANTDLGVAAINGLVSTGTAYVAAAFGLAVVLAAGFWGIKIMKKAMGKAG